jgi:hypothetical protein
MSDVSVPFPASARLRFADLMARTGVPFFLFSATLTMLLLFSWLMLLPRITKVEVSGTARDPAEMLAYKSQLVAEIVADEQARRDAVLMLHDADYDRLKTAKETPLSFENIRSAIFSQAASLGEKNAVTVGNLTYDLAGKSVRLQGDVRNVASRSMTVLAQFVEAVRALPFVASLTPPPFAREEGPDGPHSSFDFTFRLR